MSWVNSRQFQISNRNGRHYIFQRSNAGNIEINIPLSIRTKAQAVGWLRAHPDKIQKPNRARGQRRPPPPVDYYGPFNKGYSTKRSPGVAVRNFNTKERKNFQRYLAKLPFSNSPKYNTESPTMRRLRRAALKSEGQKVSPSPPRVASPKGKFSCASRKKLVKMLGKGKQGIVYLGDNFAAKVCPRDLSAAKRGDKQPPVVEFDIEKAAFAAAPFGVVEIYAMERCINFINPSNMNMANVQDSAKYDKSKQTILFMEYCSGGSLESWLSEGKRSDKMLHHLITSILKTISAIQKVYPDFRHNDLHLENVFVADRGFLIGDFGWARLKKNGTNPAVNTANTTGIAGIWGVGPNTDPRYDHHHFLNNLRSWVVRKGGFPKTLAFLDVAVPPGYRGKDDLHVTEWRLKYNDPCPEFPSLEQILKSKYITGRKFTSPNLVEARSRLKKVMVGRVKRIRSVNLVMARAKLRKVRKNTRPVINAAELRKLRAKLTANMLKARKNKLKEFKTTAKITAAIRKNPKFDKLVEYYWKNNGAVSGKNYDDAWNKARRKAVRLIELRLNRGNAPFSPNLRNTGRIKASVRLPSPPRKIPSPLRVASPPRNLTAEVKAAANRLAAAAKRLRNAAAKKVENRAKIKVINHPVSGNFQVSPGTKRIKILNPATGRMVYANGPSITLSYLKNMATRRGVVIKGLRSKEEIARKIFT